jgi:predicted N-formylglutamate amidohydrolase
MPKDDSVTAFPPRLLADDEPAPCTVLNARSTEPVLFVCDHASRCLPRALGDLGLDPAALRSHLAWDIGAGELTRQLAESLGATAVLAGYSRLVVDPNRDLLDVEAFLTYGDGVAIPGNRNLSAADRAARADAVYRPYHRAIHEQIRRLAATGRVPAMLAIHSFTPVLDGVSRPWEVGVLWDADRRIADILMRELRRAGFHVGDNEPYSGRSPQDFTIDHHAEAAGLPHAGIEVRQDLLGDAEGVARMAAVLGGIVRAFPLSIFSHPSGWCDGPRT